MDSAGALARRFLTRYNFGFVFSAELFGEKYFDDTVTAPAGLYRRRMARSLRRPRA